MDSYIYAYDDKTAELFRATGDAWQKLRLWVLFRRNLEWSSCKNLADDIGLESLRLRKTIARGMIPLPYADRGRDVVSSQHLFRREPCSMLGYAAGRGRPRAGTHLLSRFETNPFTPVVGFLILVLSVEC